MCNRLSIKNLSKFEYFSVAYIVQLFQDTKINILNSIDNYIQAEQSIHNMARFLGAIAKAYNTPLPDYSHTNLRWCEINHHLETRTFTLPDGRPVWVSYHPAHLHFHIYVNDEKDNKKMVLVKNNSLSFVKNKFVSLLNSLGLNAESFTAKLDFRFPQLLDVNDKLFLPDKMHLHLFEAIRNEANKHLHGYLQQSGLSSEVRVWENNFDTGIYCKHANGIDQYAGYAPADKEAYDKPYFYNSFFVNGKRVVPHNFKPSQNIIWETERWGGAILPMDRFDTVEDFLAAAPSFLTNTSEIFLSSIK